MQATNPVTGVTVKQENFAQAIVDGLNQSDAYRHAYDAQNMKPAVIAKEASLLIDIPNVAVRIQALREHVTDALVAKRVWDKERFIDESETNLRLARFLGQLAPANGALTLIGNATGNIKDQVAASETAFDALIKMAQVFTEVELRRQAGLPAPVVVEGEAHEVTLESPDEKQGP